jgi:glycosyltransferase involved in cell wall biosynthesis
MTPLISVIICNHNYDEYVGAAINSALNQTYENIQVVIVDDGSSDNSVEVINRAIEGHDNTIFIQQVPCVGASEARNIAINTVWDESAYFMILDSDDTALPEKAQIFYDTMVKYPSVGAVYGDYIIDDQINGLLHHEFKEPYDRNVLSQRCIVHSGSLLSKKALTSILEDGRVYDPNLHKPADSGEASSVSEDYDLWLRLSRNWMLLHVPQLLSVVRVHGDNRSNMENLDQAAVQRDFEYMRKKHN